MSGGKPLICARCQHPAKQAVPVCPVMSSFAAHLIGDRVVPKARQVVSSSGGLYDFLKGDEADSILFSDLGACLNHFTRMAQPNRPHRANGVPAPRQARLSELVELEAASLDLLDKRRRIAQNLRSQVIILQLLGSVDQQHGKITGEL